MLSIARVLQLLIMVLGLQASCHRWAFGGGWEALRARTRVTRVWRTPAGGPYGPGVTCSRRSTFISGVLMTHLLHKGCGSSAGLTEWWRGLRPQGRAAALTRSAHAAQHHSAPLARPCSPAPCLTGKMRSRIARVVDTALLWGALSPGVSCSSGSSWLSHGTWWSTCGARGGWEGWVFAPFLPKVVYLGQVRSCLWEKGLWPSLNAGSRPALCYARSTMVNFSPWSWNPGICLE